MKLRGGYFVEIGGNDGLRHSNTLALEKHLDWTGLLVEADPDLYAKMTENRPNCDHDSRAVSVGDDCMVRFSQGGAWGGLSAFLPEAWRREAYSRKTPEIWVEAVTLRTLLRQHRCPYVIDYLSLDIEGAEIPVLQEHFLFPTYQFRCMTIECLNASDLMRLQRILEPHGYVLDRVQAWDAFFLNERLR
jgi:FkbM family methyltransferase